MVSEEEKLNQAIALLEARRSELGDEVVDVALGPLRERLALLERSALASGQTASGERRIVTVMFCDVVGSTWLAQRVDPEEWADIMNTAFDGYIDCIERYGGTVARLMGDAVLAFFGAPQAHEDDPERAVRAALAIQEKTRALGQAFWATHGLRFAVRIGLNTGLVVVGDMGTESHGEYTAMGDAVNLAARMQQAAEPGTIQITENTYRYVAPIFGFEELGPVAVRGKAAPVVAYRVLGVKTRRGSLRGLGAQGLSSTLVNRERELGLVAGSVDRLVSGEGGILAVVGEAGMGKSRLLAEIASRYEASIEEGRLHWLQGRSVTYGQNIGYLPFQQIIRQFADIGEETPTLVAWYRLERQVERIFREATIEILPYLVALLNLAVEGEYAASVRHLDGETMGRMLFRAMRRFFSQLAQDAPLVLVFEDMHWADESSINLLEHLLPLVERRPLLIVFVSRPESAGLSLEIRQHAAENYGGYYTEVGLAPLTKRESMELVQNLLAMNVLPFHVRQAIVDKADGNPYFVEEFTRVLVTSGGVVRDRASGQWRATSSVDRIAIPDTLQGVIMARVDALPEDTRTILRIASVIGRSFDHRVLRAVVNDDPALDEHLNRLRDLDLIREKQRLPDLEYTFSHTLAQEVTYYSILRRTRRRLHALVGSAIETLFADHLESYYSLLAYHFAWAEDWEKAHVYLLKAGDMAGQVAADAEALAHYRQALDAYSRASANKWEPLERATLERKIGEAFVRRGEHRQALEHMERALVYLGQRLLPGSPWGMRLGIARELAVQVAFRLLPTRLLNKLIASAGEAPAEAVKVLVGLSSVYGYTDHVKFFWVLLRTLNVSEKYGLEHGMIMGYTGMGIAADLAPSRRLANRYHGLALARAVENGDREALAYAHLGTAFHALHLAHWEEALKHAGQFGQMFRELGNEHLWGLSTLYASVALLATGRLQEALEAGWEMCGLGEETADAQMTSWGYLVQGLVHRHRASFAEAAETLQEAMDFARAVPDDAAVLWAAIELGRSLAGDGQLARALEVTEENLRIAEERQVRLTGGGLSAVSLPGIAAIYLEAAEKGEGTGREQWLEQGGRAARRALKNTGALYGTRPQALLEAGRYEWQRGRPAKAQKLWREGLAQAEALGTVYDAGTILLEMGRRLGDGEYLKQAADIFGALGVHYYREQARAARGEPAAEELEPTPL
jgi:class 3 adenylate cyclase/tetratricopeptide (TPR) repeat protein